MCSRKQTICQIKPVKLVTEGRNGGALGEGRDKNDGSYTNTKIMELVVETNYIKERFFFFSFFFFF